MALFTGEAASGGLRAGLRAALARRLGEIWGLALIAAGGALALVLISYDATDPSQFSARGARRRPTGSARPAR